MSNTSPVRVLASLDDEARSVVTDEALQFIADLQYQFGERIEAMLADRQAVQARLDEGGTLDFLSETEAIREGDWTIKGTPDDLQDRRVEITGPVDRKMVINALNSGASVFMADFEDAHSPTFAGTIAGQINLRDANRGELDYVSPEGKEYALSDNPAILFARVRGWHLPEKHLEYDGKPVSGALFDFALYFLNNFQTLQDQGKGLYFYLPKMEHHQEAQVWSDVFALAEDRFGLDSGTIKCTVLIETITAAFQMDEILYALRNYIVALNAGRWDYIFSFIKRFRGHADRLMPDRAEITMERHFLRSYSRLLIKTCHKRGAHAMGGMAAQIPIKNDDAANEAAFDKVRNDKLREVTDGHDGTWVAHPDLVPVAKTIFDQHMPEPNQVGKSLPVDTMEYTAADLLKVPEGNITETGVRMNVSAALHYIAAWLAGRGAVPIHNLMEDAATAEISRAQLWQWIRNKNGLLENGDKVTAELFETYLNAELADLQAQHGVEVMNTTRYQEAALLLRKLVLEDEFLEFLTLPAYDLIVENTL